MKSNIKVLLREQFEQLTEVDWEGDFKDVKKTCLNPTQIVDYLNRVRANAGKDTNDREKFDRKMPFIHSKSRALQDTDSGVDVDHFIAKITEKPNNIINTNDKILKTGGRRDFVYKTGIPAFRGILYDKDNDKFFIINTCPGAGSCVLVCYALRGRYIQYQNSYDSMTRRLNYLLNHPDLYEEQMYQELKAKAEEHGAKEGYKNRVLLRWNDSGDFFTDKYINIANNVMTRLKADGYNVDSYAYTKTADNLDKADFETTFSDDANKMQTQKADVENRKVSKILPKVFFKELNLNKLQDEQVLKDRVAKSYNLDPNTILTFDEMLDTPKGDERKWHVIVTPNDGDDAAYRKDVKTIFLAEH